MAQRFLGTWRMLTELSKYDVGAPPTKATYTLAPSQNHPGIIDFQIAWTDHEGKDNDVKYQGELGVKKQEKYMGVDVLILHEIDEKGSLNSTVWTLNQHVLTKSFRELKDNDQRLEVVMETNIGNAVNRTFQVYQRVQ